jgi:hypothetical protein
MNLLEKNQKKLRRELRKIDERLQFEAQEFLASLLKQPLKQRVRVAWRILRG